MKRLVPLVFSNILIVYTKLFIYFHLYVTRRRVVIVYDFSVHRFLGPMEQTNRLPAKWKYRILWAPVPWPAPKKPRGGRSRRVSSGGRQPYGRRPMSPAAAVLRGRPRVGADPMAGTQGARRQLICAAALGWAPTPWPTPKEPGGGRSAPRPLWAAASGWAPTPWPAPNEPGDCHSTRRHGWAPTPQLAPK